MAYQTLRSVLDLQLQELYSAEAHVAKELKHFIDGAVSTEFKSQLLKHGEETKRHMEALALVLQKRNLSLTEGKCRVMDALIKKGNDVVQSRGSDVLLDLGLVFIMRAIDTLEQIAYENARTVAEAVGEEEVVALLDKHLREEGQQERSWTVLAEDMVDALVAAASKAKHTPAERSEGAQA